MRFIPAPDFNVIVPGGLAVKFQGPANPRYEWARNDHGQRLSVLRYEAENAKADIILQTGLNEPKEKYSEIHRHLYEDGFSVHAMDWAYQGLSDGAAEHRRRHTNGVQSDVADFASFVDHVRQREVVNSRPLIVCGHSYGGHVISHYLGDAAHKADGVYLTAPMFDFNFFQGTDVSALSPWGMPLAGLARALAFLHGSDAYAPSALDWTEDFRNERRHVYSNDPEREKLHNMWLIANPKAQIGGTTLKWVIDAVENCRSLRGKNFDHLRIPFKIAIADGEIISQNSAMFEMADRVPGGEAIEIGNSLHELFVCNDRVIDETMTGLYKVVSELNL